MTLECIGILMFILGFKSYLVGHIWRKTLYQWESRKESPSVLEL